MNKIEVPCYYCDGQGHVHWAEPDGTSGEETCSECEGTGISCRRAGQRNTRAPQRSYWIGATSFTGDVLALVSSLRGQIVAAKRDRDRAWRLPYLRNQYAAFRSLATRPVRVPERAA